MHTGKSAKKRNFSYSEEAVLETNTWLQVSHDGGEKPFGAEGRGVEGNVNVVLFNKSMVVISEMEILGASFSTAKELICET